MNSRHVRSGILVLALAGLCACASSSKVEDETTSAFLADNEAASKAFLEGDVPAAAALWAPWASEGWADAQFGMGLVSERRVEAPQDSDEALHWYQLAGDQGHPSANVRRAQLLTVRGETEAATAAYLHAAGCGDARAIVALNNQDIDFKPASPCLGQPTMHARNEARMGQSKHVQGRDGVHAGARNTAPTHSIRVKSSAER